MSGPNDCPTRQVFTQVNDALAKDRIDCKPRRRVGNQPSALIMGRRKNGLIL